jgi:hypothetical protein
MSRSVPIPYFPVPPSQYSQNYLAEVTRAFSVYVQQSNNPGPLQATTLKLTNLPVFPDNAAALAGDLVEGDVYRTATGELRIVV